MPIVDLKRILDKTELVKQLQHIHAIKTGHFTLKSGVTSPIYIDLRPIIAYPILLSSIGEMIWQTVAQFGIGLICGVPYTALPIATSIALQHDLPMLMRRKEAKTYGTKKQIEGVYQPNQECIIIEDVVTSGASVLETVVDLQKAGLRIKHVAAFLDREQGGKERLAAEGLQLHTAFTLPELLSILNKLDIPL